MAFIPHTPDDIAGMLKVVGVGSIEIIPSEESMPSAVWQTIPRPKEILERLRAAIARAKQSGGPSAS